MDKKPPKRKAFNFLRSYYEVLKRLDKDEDKLSFLMAVIERQFDGKQPNLKGISDFAYASQQHSIDSSRDGWESNPFGTKKDTPSKGGIKGGSKGGGKGASVQEKEKEKEEEVKEFLNQENLRFDTARFMKANHNIELQDHSNWVDRFILKLIADAEIDKPLNDIRKHFNNWLAKQDHKPKRKSIYEAVS